ncbi:MAG: energy transducer TonB [Sphingomicrobium sp.]
MRILSRPILALTLSAASAATGQPTSQPPSSIPQGPPGTVTVETFLGDIEKWALRRDGGINPQLLNAGQIFTQNHYPELAVDREVEGDVTVVVDVNEGGLATHCKTVGNPPPELAGPTCALFLVEARFVPAFDRKRRPVKGTYQRKIAWRLEPVVPVPFGNTFDRVIVDFDAQGVAAGCRREQSEGMPIDEEEPDPCDEIRMPAQMLGVMAGVERLADWELRFEMLSIPGETIFWKGLGEGANEKLLSRRAFQQSVSADGSVIQCTEIGTELRAPVMNNAMSCRETKRTHYSPAADAQRKIQMVNVIFLKQKALRTY